MTEKPGLSPSHRQAIITFAPWLLLAALMWAIGLTGYLALWPAAQRGELPVLHLTESRP